MTGTPSSNMTAKATIPSKRKASNASAKMTADGRKVARKTAHSLIERRRRSKMNEEFEVLKDMIPECNGQEMHKLAILQASTRYMRWLEENVAKLNAINSEYNHNSLKDTSSSIRQLRSNTTTPSLASDDSGIRDLPSIHDVLSEYLQLQPVINQTSTPVSLTTLQHSTSISVSPRNGSSSDDHPLHPNIPASTVTSLSITVTDDPKSIRVKDIQTLPSSAVLTPVIPKDQEAGTASLVLSTNRHSWGKESRPQLPSTGNSASDSVSEESTGGRRMSIQDVLIQ